MNTDSGTALDFAGLISTGQTALDNTMASSLPKKGRIACQPANCPCAKPGCFGPAQILVDGPAANRATTGAA